MQLPALLTRTSCQARQLSLDSSCSLFMLLPRSPGTDDIHCAGLLVPSHCRRAPTLRPSESAESLWLRANSALQHRHGPGSCCREIGDMIHVKSSSYLYLLMLRLTCKAGLADLRCQWKTLEFVNSKLNRNLRTTHDNTKHIVIWRNVSLRDSIVNADSCFTCDSSVSLKADSAML
jgi:hypothetical protein